MINSVAAWNRVVSSEPSEDAMARVRRDMAEMTAREFFSQLPVKYWVKIGVTSITVLVAVYSSGARWGLPYSRPRTAKTQPAQDRFRVTVASGQGVSLFDGTLILSLEPSDLGDDRLAFGGISGWSDSPGGPFLVEASHSGPVYRQGFRTYIRLLNGDIWSVSVLVVHEHSVEIEFRAHSS